MQEREGHINRGEDTDHACHDSLGHQLAESQVFASGDPKQIGKGLWNTAVFSYNLCGEVRLPSSAADTNCKQDEKERACGAGRTVFQQPDGGGFPTFPEPPNVASHHVGSQALSWGHERRMVLDR